MKRRKITLLYLSVGHNEYVRNGKEKVIARCFSIGNRKKKDKNGLNASSSDGHITKAMLSPVARMRSIQDRFLSVFEFMAIQASDFLNRIMPQRASMRSG